MIGAWQVMKMGAILRHSALVWAMYQHNPRAMEIAMNRHLRFVDDVYEGLWHVWSNPLKLKVF